MNSCSWTEKFGLQQNPFKDTLNTDLFYRTSQHEEALVKIRIGMDDSHALILLTGMSGTGKTLVSQLVIRSLDQESYLPVFIPVYPGMGKGMLLQQILSEMGCKDIGRYTHDRLSRLQEEAMNRHETGQRLVVIIDEAHFLKADALHILRTLSNLETEHEKLVTVLLIAEESLKKRLNSPSYASLRGRITFAVSLKPLNCAETEQFIKYRLLKCGGPPQLLTDNAYETVFRMSKGIPREINRLLYNGFLEALSCDLPSITAGLLQQMSIKTGICHGKIKQTASQATA
ncbi:MAG: AAA family ATPase [Desulfobulbaceae bacterium]|nr:AAA family ATPase [Desulfobulbaceae bacterium]